MKNLLFVGLPLFVLGAAAVWVFTAEKPEGTTREVGKVSQRQPGPLTEDEKREILATAPEFSEALEEEWALPEGVRAPDSVGALDVELRDEMLRELSSIEIIERALSEDARTRLAARDALKINKQEHVRAVERALEQSESAEDRMLALRGAQILGVQLFEQQLLDVARSDADVGVRQEAANVLASAPSSGPAIVVALEDASWGVRLSALGAGEQIQRPSPELAQAVVQLLNDSKPVIRKRAHRVVSKWAGDGFGYDYAQSSAERQASIQKAAAWASSLD